MDERLRKVFMDVFGADQIEDSSSPETIEQWDSMGHLILVSELERCFNISLSVSDIVEMVNVRCIKEVLQEHGVNG